MSLAERVRRVINPHEIAAILTRVAANPDAKDSDRIAAVRELYDRGGGKAPQQLDVTQRDETHERVLEVLAPMSLAQREALAGLDLAALHELEPEGNA